MTIYLPYTYLIEWTALGIRYYGCRYKKGCHPDQFWVDYYTSSKIVKAFRKKHGDPDKKEIRKVFSGLTPSKETAKNVTTYEHTVLRRINARGNPHYLNRSNGNNGGTQSNKGLKRYTNGSVNKMFLPGTEPKGFELGAPNCAADTGKRAYNNGIDEIKCYPGEQPKGWVKGSLQKPTLGKKAYNNGIDEIKCSPGEQPKGWVKGTLCESTAGMKFYSNGKETKLFYPGTQPVEWTEQGPNVGKAWYNNGKQAKKFVPGTEPEGWTEGSNMVTNRGKKYFIYQGVTKMFVPGTEPKGFVPSGRPPKR